MCHMEHIPENKQLIVLRVRLHEETKKDWRCEEVGCELALKN